MNTRQCNIQHCISLTIKKLLVPNVTEITVLLQNYYYINFNIPQQVICTCRTCIFLFHSLRMPLYSLNCFHCSSFIKFNFKPPLSGVGKQNNELSNRCTFKSKCDTIKRSETSIVEVFHVISINHSRLLLAYWS